MYNEIVLSQHQRVKSKTSCEDVSAHVLWRGDTKCGREEMAEDSTQPVSSGRKSHLIRNQVYGVVCHHTGFVGGPRARVGASESCQKFQVSQEVGPEIVFFQCSPLARA